MVDKIKGDTNIGQVCLVLGPFLEQQSVLSGLTMLYTSYVMYGGPLKFI